MATNTEANIALLLSILACFMTAASFILQKKALIDKEKEQSATKKSSACMSTQWLLGFLLVIVSSVLNVATMPFLDMVVMSQLSSVTLMFNSILSAYLLKEVFTRYDFCAFVIISIGASGCVFLSNDQSVEYSGLNQLLEILTTRMSMAIIVFSYSFIVYAYLFYQQVESKLQTYFQTFLLASQSHPEIAKRQQKDFAQTNIGLVKIQPSSSQLTLLVLETDSEIISEVASTPTDLNLHVKANLFMISWSSGLLSAMNTLCFKVIGELVKNQATNENEQSNLIYQLPLYILLIFGIGGAVIQLTLLNMGMKNYSQMQVMPIYQSSIILNTLMVGLFVLNESQFYNNMQIMMFFGCCAICIVGIFIIIKKPAQSNSKVQSNSNADKKQLTNDFLWKVEQIRHEFCSHTDDKKEKKD